MFSDPSFQTSALSILIYSKTWNSTNLLHSKSLLIPCLSVHSIGRYLPSICHVLAILLRISIHLIPVAPLSIIHLLESQQKLLVFIKELKLKWTFLNKNVRKKTPLLNNAYLFCYRLDSFCHIRWLFAPVALNNMAFNGCSIHWHNSMGSTFMRREPVDKRDP